MEAPALAIIGGGNMGTALLRGGLRGGFLAPGRLVVAEPEAGRRAEIEAMSVAATSDACEALRRLDDIAGPGGGEVLLAVKPQMLQAVGDEVGGMVGGRVVISILAGTPGARVRERLGGGSRVVRAMPNLPATIGRGATAVCLSAGAGPGDDGVARGLFACAGPAVMTIDESMMDAFTAVAGSGPAYVFLLAEAMVEAAERLGFGGDSALEMVRATIAGAGELLAGSAEGPATLRGAVTSRGGTTAAAIAVLESAGVKEAVARAVAAARDRGRELAELA